MLQGDTKKNDSQSLTGIILLASLSAAEKERLATQCRWRRYGPAQQVIGRETETMDAYFVVEGVVRVVDYSLSGREVSFEDIEAGGCFGELAAIDGQPRSASVVALEDTLVASLSSDAFRRLVHEHSGVAMRLLQRLTLMVRRASERIMDLSTLGAQNRVYAEVLRLAHEVEEDDNTATIRPIAPHSDIASRVSTTRETVARVLSDLAKIGVVRRQGTALVVLDVQRLTEMVEQFKTI